MTYQLIPMQIRKRIALLAHDNKKDDWLKWGKFNPNSLREHEIFASGTTGCMLEKELEIPINKLRSGPLGDDVVCGSMQHPGDVQLGFGGFRLLLAIDDAGLPALAARLRRIRTTPIPYKE